MSNWKKLDFSQTDSKEPPSSLEIEFSRFITITEKHKFKGSKYGTLKHSELTQHIEKFIKVNSVHGMNLELMKFPLKENSFYNQLRIFIYKLKAFSYFQEKKLINSEENLGEILLGTLRGGFKFNSDYKKKLEEKTRLYLKGITNIVYQDFPDYHLLPWLDEEDIKKIYVFTDPLPIKEDKLQKVIEEMNNSIIDDAFIRDIDLIDALYLLNQKKTAHETAEGKTKTSFDARGNELDISYPDFGLEYLFKKVTTNPSTSRAAGLPTVKTRNLVYAAHSNLDKVTLSGHDLYREGLDPSTWSLKMSKRENTHYIMVDFKKSGLTTNREVIKAVYKTALKHYPGFRPWVAYLENLDNIRVNGMQSKRGTSLGMDDNALSFFLGCAFEVFKNSHYLGKLIEAYFKGDDQLLIIQGDEEIAKQIFRDWVKELRDLGLLINAKKSFIGVRGQFCEIVGHGDSIDNKIIGYSLNCFDALGSYNIVEFKIFLNNLKKDHDRYKYAQIFDFCMSSAIFMVEPEFCNYEITAPFEMGGYFSEYEHGLNVFLVNVEERKFKTDRRLFNLIGWKRPEVSYEYRKSLKLFYTDFKDLEGLIKKMKRYSAKPMSKKWKDSYDECYNRRQEMFRSPILDIGAQVQYIVDFKESYALPISRLIRKENKERTYVPMKKFKGKIRSTMIEHFKTVKRDMIIKAEKKYYLIDEIRARELLLTAQTGNNTYLINYYHKVPCSTLIWSICKLVTRSEWAIPIDWLEYAYKTQVSLDKLWRYYGSKGIHLYDYRPYFEVDKVVINLFRGPDNVNTDSVIMCPYSGFPLKFSSWDYRAFVENYCRGHHTKSKRFWMDLSEHYYSEWQDDLHMESWWGPNGRNKPVKKDWFVKKVLEQTSIYSIEDYYEKVLLPEQIQRNQSLLEYIENDDETMAEMEKSNEFEEEHYSDSDLLEDYFKENFLNTDSDEEEDPYRNLSDTET